MMYLCSLVILKDTTKAIIITSVIPIVFFIIQFLEKNKNLNTLKLPQKQDLLKQGLKL